MRLLQDEMRLIDKYLIILFLALISCPVTGQTDEDPPKSPVFTFININPANNKTEMTWTSSISPDVAGYVVYSYKDGEGYAIDTIYDPDATSFDTLWQFTDMRPESFVIAAIDYSDNISPLSNELSTIHTVSSIDTCENKINITWNKYISEPVKVTGYDVFASVNGGTYYLAGHVSGDITSFIIDDFENGSDYCFIIKSILENTKVSGSNKSCITVRKQNPPGWINADYATVTAEGYISLSFSIDPASEIDLFALERRNGYSGSFVEIAKTVTLINSVTYIDKTAEKNLVNFYRLSAINSCNNKVVSSNMASNIVLGAQNTGNVIILHWNQYHDWNGSLSSYRIYTDAGNGFIESGVTEQGDTIFTVSIPEIMYTLTQGKVCFYVNAAESGNPYGINGESNSNQVCSDIEEVITVPNIFTPDGDLKNDLFKPVLTFTPTDYRLVISSRLGKVLFETNDFMDAWNGSDNGDPVPEGVYLWFLKIKTPAGKDISRTGTLTVLMH
jgi:gliding motility-associated-like protein